MTSEQEHTMVDTTSNRETLADEPKLRISGLVKRFEGSEVLHGLDFDVRDGEFLSILGTFGSAVRRPRCAFSSVCWHPTRA